MDKKEIVKKVIENKKGIAKVSDMINAGVSREDIKRLYADGYIKRVSQGYYQLSSTTDLTDEQIISSVAPKSVVCMESALFYYGYTDFMPRVKSLAIPRTSSRKAIDSSPIPLKIYYVSSEIYELGKTIVTDNGVTFSIYDRERTICDIFKHRNKIDNETFNKALNAYVKDDKKNLNNLSAYAKKLRVYKKVMELMEVTHLDSTEKKKSRDFNIYYLNFSKVYEIAMMINNVILTKIETDKSSSFEEQYGFTSSISAQGTKQFLDGIKASISADARETATSSSKVVESLDVKTTKSILLRRVIEQCASVDVWNNATEGDLIKVDHVKLELLNEESLRQFLILRRDALKGMRVEGMEINNLVSSMLQDYAYIMKGRIFDKDTGELISEIIIKIPMEIQSEFENKYNINDLLIGHVSIVGIYKGVVSEEFISSNTFTYFQEVGARKEKQESTTNKIIKSNSHSSSPNRTKKSHGYYHFIDTLAIIQDVTFKLEEVSALKLHWWNRFGIWLSKWRRK